MMHPNHVAVSFYYVITINGTNSQTALAISSNKRIIHTCVVLLEEPPSTAVVVSWFRETVPSS